MGHARRLNKRPLTGKYYEKFGSYTQSLFKIDNTKPTIDEDNWRAGPTSL